MGRRGSSLLLFVAGYLAMASLAPAVALVPALLSFFAGVLVLVREPQRRDVRLRRLVERRRGLQPLEAQPV